MFGLFKKKPDVKHWLVPNGECIVDQEVFEFGYSSDFVKKSTVAMLGKKDGQCITLDLATAPHILIAGVPGSGKSVCIETLVKSLVIKNSPSEIEFFFIDPKMVDYVEFKNLPHTKDYATDINGAKRILSYLHGAMMERFDIMQKNSVKNICDLPGYGRKILVFDEFASLMSREGKKEILPLINDIARLGRAAGVHLILATQRPDRTVIDGQLKANCPTRICFRVQSSTDSRVILDQKGGEILNGKGDGVLMDCTGRLHRFQGLMMSDSQTRKIFDSWSWQDGTEKCLDNRKRA